MRYPILIALLASALAAQGQPNCNGISRDVDVRCACVKDPSSKLCEMVKAGFYDTDGPKTKALKPINLGWGASISQPRTASPATARTARPRQARVVPLAHTDYLRFLHPNAVLAAGFNFEKVFRSPELMESLFGPAEGGDARNKVIAALKEMDHLWLSFVPPHDVVVLTTGKFEQGAAAGMFYAQGIWPVFLGGARAMMIGSEPSIQAALARLAKPSTGGGWVARRARELSQDQETWVACERPAANASPPSAVDAIRRFALGLRMTGEAGVRGEAIADSEDAASQIAAWVEQMKSAIRGKTGTGPLDSLNVERDGATLRFAAKGDSLLGGESGKMAMNSDFGVELYSLTMAGFPGVPPRTVAQDKMSAVRTGMKREEVLTLLGQPLSVHAIQGLETPRETWTYQVAFGKQFSVRLDAGVVAAPPR